MVSLEIQNNDLRDMTFTELNEQKEFLKNTNEENLDKKLVNEQNKNNINKEINARYTKYALIAGVGIIVGMYALRKFKKSG
jgi:hypothetical protein|tara:strand:+ start:1322 stop:1564 length:243 start_codon:yes stop_codon:yes gene_type:complete